MVRCLHPLHTTMSLIGHSASTTEGEDLSGRMGTSSARCTGTQRVSQLHLFARYDTPRMNNFIGNLSESHIEESNYNCMYYLIRCVATVATHLGFVDCVLT